ncbi:MAG: hypothetical protein AAF682_03405 [Planctomycetota bacterium]
MKRLLLAAAGLCVAASAASAQTYQRIQGPITPLRIDDQGRVGPGVAWSPFADTPGTTFSNVTTSGFFGQPLVAEEWVDWGVKAGALSGVTCTLEFAYGTTAVDPTLGGPGADIEIAVYEGTLGTCTVGDVATEARRLSFTGLPGSLDGNPAGFTVTVDLAGDGFLLADGPVGWSYVGVDGVTGPLLITVGSDPTSTVDGFDLYVPSPAATGICLGTFGFPTTGVGSFYLRLEEDDATEPGSQTPRAGTGVNVGVLSVGTQLPKIGQAWDPSITTPAVGTPVLDFLALSSISTPPIFVPGFGELLIGVVAPNPLAVIAGPVGSGSPFAVPFPLNCNFIGVSLTSQAGQVDTIGAIALTDAVDFTIGI